MHKARIPKSAFSARGREPNFQKAKNYSPKNTSSKMLSEREALQIFNQVLANKSNILKKDSDNTFYTKKTVKTLKLDSNGNEVIEKFEATSFGGFTPAGEKLGEVIQRYCNENTGVEKTSLQRVMGNKLRRVEVKKTLGCEFTKEYSENIDLGFEKEWKVGAKNLGVKRIIGFENKVDVLSQTKNL